jgi:hypothetical protein
MDLEKIILTISLNNLMDEFNFSPNQSNIDTFFRVKFHLKFIFFKKKINRYNLPQHTGHPYISLVSLNFT